MTEIVKENVELSESKYEVVVGNTLRTSASNNVVTYADYIYDKEIGARQSEINKVVAKLAAAGSLTKEIVNIVEGQTAAQALAAIENPSDTTIYMVKKADEGEDIYDEYLYFPASEDSAAHFELIGSTATDLSDYYTKSETYSKTEINTQITNLDNKINTAVSGGLVGAELVIDGNAETVVDNNTAKIPVTSNVSNVAEGDRSKTLVNVDALNAAIAAAADDYAKASDLTTLSGKVDTLEGSVDVLTESVNALESTVGSLSSTVGTVEGKVTTLESTVGSLSSTVGTVEGKVTTLEGSVSDLEDSVGAIQTAVDGLDDKIDDKIDAAIGDEGVVTNAIKDTLSGYQTELTFTTNPGQNGILVVTSGEDDKEGDVINSSISMSYDSESKKIQIKNSSGALVAEMDATAFIKDGMLSSIALEEGTGDDAGKTYMVFTWNTDSGHDVVKLDVSEFLKQLKSVVLGDANGISNGVVTIAAVKTGEALAAAAGGEATKDKLTTAGAVKEYVDSTITAEMSKIPELTENSAGSTYGLLSLNVLDAVLDKHVMSDDDITAALNAVDVI